MNTAEPVVPWEVEITGEKRRITPRWRMFFDLLAGYRSLIEDTHANRLEHHAARQSRAGTLFIETDRKVRYIRSATEGAAAVTTVDADSSGAVLNVASTTGIVRGDKLLIAEGTAREEVRFVASVNAGVSVNLTRALDHTHTAVQADTVAAMGPVWTYHSGVMRNTLANKPADLGTHDEGFLFFAENPGTPASDYRRLFRWTGSAWTYADGQKEAKEIIWYPGSVPSGYALCDGSSVTVTLANATTASFTTPNLVGRYAKGASSYTGANVAAVAPGLTGETADESSHTHSVTINNDFTGVNGSNSTVQSGTGATVAASGHVHATNGQTVTSAAGSAHKHGKGTLAVDATAEPANVGLVPCVKL
jgi:hypothetical protein